MLYQLSYRKAVQERNKWPLYLLKYHCILVFLCRCEHNLPFVFVQQKGRKCSRTQKSPEPLRLRYAGCRSTRLYRPNYCGTCLDGRCCSPRRTRTAPVLFTCPDGEHFERAIMFVQSCKCNDECGHLNDAALPPQRWLYGDMHKFVD